MPGGSNTAALRTALAAAEARAAIAAAKVSEAEAEITFLKLTIEKLRRELFGWRSERKQRLLDQLELQLLQEEDRAPQRRELELAAVLDHWWTDGGDVRFRHGPLGVSQRRPN